LPLSALILYYFRLAAFRPLIIFADYAISRHFRHAIDIAEDYFIFQAFERRQLSPYADARMPADY
jgi:hypothetical protein